MSQKLNNIMHSFNITKEVLDDRKNIGLYIESLASLIVERSYDYFLSNADFSKSLQTSNLARLKRIRIQFIVSLFKDEFNDIFLEKLARSHQDSLIEPTPYIIAADFEIMQQTIIDISSVNHQLKRDLKTILKFLHIAEFVVQNDPTINTHLQKDEESVNFVQALETLYKMLAIHKTKSDLLIRTWENGTLCKPRSNDLPVEDVSLCQFSDTILKLQGQILDIEESNIDIAHINEWHTIYHNNVTLLYNLIDAKAPLNEQADQINTIKTVSEKLFEYINKPYESSSSLAFLCVNSGIRFIQQYSTIINETKFIPFDDSKKLLLFIEQLIEKSLKHSLLWLVASYSVSQTQPSENHDIDEVIFFSHSAIYITLNLKDVPYKSFIFDVINIFLEILKTTLINREKEYTLISLANRAETANRSKDIFLANMSHELRTPLNAIIGFSQILQMRPEVPENIRLYIEKISISGKNLLDLVNTILDFAKLEAGKISFHPKITLLSQVVNEVSIITATMAEAKNITLELPTDISLALFIDMQLIKQALINILSNAIKFTPENGKITFSIDFNNTQNEYIMTISDTGIGMSKESISKLFTPFTQIDNHLQSSSKGTGLGLVITKRIIEDLHKGRIWVESEEGVGSSFHIAIPVSDSLTKVELFECIKNKANRLLIVEDNQEYVDLLVAKLNQNFHLTVTNSVNRAKEMLENNAYNKIILDFFLIDGISSEVLYFMEKNKIQTPVYIISAEDDFKIVEHLQESKNIVGVFNKKDVEVICDTLIKAENG